MSSVQVVLLQELERWNNLVRKMAASLQDLQRALVCTRDPPRCGYEWDVSHYRLSLFYTHTG